MTTAQAKSMIREAVAEIKQHLSVTIQSAVNTAIRQNTTPRLDSPAKLLTPSQAAAFLNCTSVHIMDLVDEGRIQATDIASPGASRKRLRIRAGDLQAFADRQRSAEPLRRP